MKFLGKEIASPFVLASGILGISASSMLRAVRDGAGMVTTKSLSLTPRAGHDSPIIAEFDGGLTNSVGLTNPGIYEGLVEVEKYKRETDAPIIVSIFGRHIDDFAELAKLVNQSSADFIELNLSCPNVEDEFSRPFALDIHKVGKIVASVSRVTTIPFLTKLSPNAPNIIDIAKHAEEKGSHGATLINTLGHGMVIDIYTAKPVLKNHFGGISGPAIKPLAVKIVHDAYKRLNTPIIGTGGVTTGNDAIEMLMVGATTVGVGTAVYYRGVDVFKALDNELNAFIQQSEFTHWSELIGRVHRD